MVEVKRFGCFLEDFGRLKLLFNAGFFCSWKFAATFSPVIGRLSYPLPLFTGEYSYQVGHFRFPYLLWFPFARQLSFHFQSDEEVSCLNWSMLVSF